MINNVNTVLVTSTTQLAAPAKTAGQIIVEDEKGNLITAAITNNKLKFRFGLVSSKTLSYTDQTGAVKTINPIQYSNYMTLDDITSCAGEAYKAPVQDKVEINFTYSTIKAGLRYVIRLIYKDLYEHPGQFTHTYEYIAIDGDTTTTVAAAFAALINKDTRKRCTANADAAILTLTALEKDDNEGLESINIYTRVNLNAVVWYTDPSAAGFASKNKYEVSKLIITKSAGDNGNGYWKQVRDREQAALSYRGITNRTWFPVIKPSLNTVVGDEYATVVIEFKPVHANAEDGFRKTKQSVELYITSGTSDTTSIAKILAPIFTNGFLFLQSAG